MAARRLSRSARGLSQGLHGHGRATARCRCWRIAFSPVRRIRAQVIVSPRWVVPGPRAPGQSWSGRFCRNRVTAPILRSVTQLGQAALFFLDKLRPTGRHVENWQPRFLSAWRLLRGPVRQVPSFAGRILRHSQQRYPSVWPDLGAGCFLDLVPGQRQPLDVDAARKQRQPASIMSRVMSMPLGHGRLNEGSRAFVQRHASASTCAPLPHFRL